VNTKQESIPVVTSHYTSSLAFLNQPHVSYNREEEKKIKDVTFNFKHLLYDANIYYIFEER
jgi:hypothetical protein